MDNIILFIFIGLTTLLPIIPAYLFFKVIPSKTSEVDGTFGSLKFKLSGAFAGYFLMVFILIMVFKDSLTHEETWQIWEVDGTVEFANGMGSPEAIKVCVNPPNLATMGDQFKLKVLKRPGHSGELEFPQLIVSHENFIPEEIVFSEDDKVDQKAKRVVLANTVVLNRIP